MHYDRGTLIYSPTDICRFADSRFGSWMDRLALERPDACVAAPVGEDVQLVRRKGRDHEQAYLQSLIDSGGQPFDPRGQGDVFRETVSAMRRGEALIQQGALALEPLRGYADLLVRVEQPSNLGGHAYVPREIKLGMRARPKYTLQLCAYAEMLEAVQGWLPDRLELVLGDSQQVTLPTHEFLDYYREQRDALFEFQQAFDVRSRPASVTDCRRVVRCSNCTPSRRSSSLTRRLIIDLAIPSFSAALPKPL